VTKRPSIILAVTIADSVKLLGRLPGHLADGGWEVHLVSSPGARLEAYAGSLVQIHPIAMERKPSPLRDLQALLAWIRLIRKVRPDVVSLGTPKASLLGLVAASLLRIPVRVYTLRGLRLETLKGTPRFVQFFAELVAACLATHIIAVSHSLRMKYLELGLTSSNKITVLGPGSSHGVDTRKFRPLSSSRREALRQEIGLPRGVPILGFVGRFSEDKGASVLLETRKHLLREKVDHFFLVIGYVEDSHKIFDELRLLGRGLTFIENAVDSSPFFSLMDLLLLPTKREGFPNVVLEAALSRVPTVTTNVTGAIDSVLHRKSGMICEPHSPHEFSSSVCILLRDNPLRKALGSFAQTWVSAEFDDRVVLRLTESFYADLVSNPAGQRP
jgi:glycosyltransferase involved in cell wall biosynthesis